MATIVLLKEAKIEPKTFNFIPDNIERILLIMMKASDLAREIRSYIDRILSAGWVFPVWAAAAPMRVIRLSVTVNAY